MKKWICTVCGYVHHGEEPPDFCPMCGAPKEMFRLLTGPGDGLRSDSPGPALPPIPASEREADVLVVGSGAAALSAAITARKQGASVIMLEKGPAVGGTTIRSGGGFWVPNNRFQRALGIDETGSEQGLGGYLPGIYIE